MKNLIYLLIITLVVIGCENQKREVCNCCEFGFEKIEKAQNCIEENPNTDSTSDNRLLLLAFVPTKNNAAENSGWKIIKDPEIVSEAKKNYLLITLDPTEKTQLVKNGSTKLLDIIEKHKTDSHFFVIVNQSLYPFADWNLEEHKETIIDHLQVGNGP